MHSVSKCNKSGFTLIELSIVLVVIGLIVGGVLVGRDLIRAAELRGVISQYQSFLTATSTFQGKYAALPGDMTNATSIWGAADPTPATCATTASTTVLTCNGNGDGILVPSAGSVEAYRYWQQLANAGLIPGRFDGITHGPNNYSSTTANSPSGNQNNSLWFLYHYASLSANAYYFDGMYGNFFTLGGYMANYAPNGSLFRPKEVMSIDKKIDDGKPALGKFVVQVESGLSACTTTVSNDPTNLNADYLTSTNNLTCTPLFRQLF